MSSVALLDKTRKIGNLLHNNTSVKVVFSDICKVMTDILGSDVYVISKKGKLLGSYVKSEQVIKDSLITQERGKFINKELNDRFLGVLSTKENCNLITMGFEFANVSAYRAIITPINVAGERFGTLFIYRKDNEYTIDDIILAEYGATVVGLEMMRSESAEMEEDERRMLAVKAGLDALTATEQRAVKYMFDALDNGEGIIVTSRIADEVGITRSVLVNALKKLESAGVIESRSAGMKGTYVKVVNEVIYEELGNY